MLNTATEIDHPANIAQQNEHIFTGTVHQMASLIDNSYNQSRKFYLELVKFNINFVNSISALVQKDTPITEATVKRYIGYLAQDKIKNFVSDHLFPEATPTLVVSTDPPLVDNGLVKVILKSKSLNIGIPFLPDSIKDQSKYLAMSGYVYDLVQAAEINVNQGVPLEATNILLGGYRGKRSAGFTLFIRDVFGDRRPVRQATKDQVSLVSETYYPNLYLVHTLKRTDVATEQHHQYYLSGINQLPKGYVFQPEINELR